MILTNIFKASHWFEVLQTTATSQTAMMTLASGKSSGPTAEAHEHSDQILLVLEGEAFGEIGSESTRMIKGDVVIIPAGVKHRFSNPGDEQVVTFSVYAPPAFKPGEVG